VAEGKEEEEEGGGGWQERQGKEKRQGGVQTEDEEEEEERLRIAGQVNQLMENPKIKTGGMKLGKRVGATRMRNGLQMGGEIRDIDGTAMHGGKEKVLWKS